MKAFTGGKHLNRERKEKEKYIYIVCFILKLGIVSVKNGYYIHA